MKRLIGMGSMGWGNITIITMTAYAVEKIMCCIYTYQLINQNCIDIKVIFKAFSGKITKYLQFNDKTVTATLQHKNEGIV